MLPQKISSGIEGFDDLCGGGIPRGKTLLVAGEPGTGKTTFALQFLLEGTRRGDKCLFIAIDEKPEQILQNARGLGWDLEPYLKAGSLEFLDITAYFGARRLIHEKFNFDRVIDNIFSFVSERKPQRIAIDPISPLIFSNSRNPDLAYYIRKLIFRLESSDGFATILTSPVPVGSDRYSRHGVAEFVASGIVLLRWISQNNNPMRSVSLKKLRGSTMNPSEHLFEILTERGIVLRQVV